MLTRLVRRRRTGWWALAAGAALGLSACSLDVNDPDIVTPDDVSDPASLPLAITGAIGDLQLALDDYSLYVGMFVDEFILAGTFPSRQQVDERSMLSDNGTLNNDMYTLLHVARFSGDNLAQGAGELVGNPDADQDLVANALAVGQYNGAYVRMLLAEAYCQSILGGGDEFNPNTETAPLGPDERMQDALSLYQAAQASAASAGLTDLVTAAKIGEARAQMFLGNYAQAASVAATVSEGFLRIAEYSSNQSSQFNEVYVFTYGDTQQIRWTVGDGTQSERHREKFAFYDEWVDVGLIDPSPDPVLFSTFTGTIFVHLQLIYGRGIPVPSAPGQSASIFLGTGFEADIMEAEAMYRAGNVAGAESLINSRLTTGANPHGKNFDPVDLTGTFASDIVQIGRAYEAGAWLTGHRFGFFRRVIRNDGVDLFPTVQPGSDTAFPITKQEIDNNEFVSQACPSGPPWS